MMVRHCCQAETADCVSPPAAACSRRRSLWLSQVLLAVGRVLCGAALCWYLGAVDWSGYALLSGCLLCLSQLALLPAILLMGVTLSLSLGQLLSSSLWWLIIALCGSRGWLQVTQETTVHADGLMLMLLLSAAAAACFLITAANTICLGPRSPRRQRAASRPKRQQRPPPLVPAGAQHSASGPMIRLIALDSPTDSPRSDRGRSWSPSAVRSSSPSSPASSTASPQPSPDFASASSLYFIGVDSDSSPSSSDETPSPPRSPPRRHRHHGSLTAHARQEQPEMRQQDAHRQYCTFAAEEKEQEEEGEPGELQEVRACCSVQTVISIAAKAGSELTAAALPSASPADLVPHFLSARCCSSLWQRLPHSMPLCLGVSVLSCVGFAVFDATSLLPLYAESRTGLERITLMAPSILLQSLGLLLSALFVYCIRSPAFLSPFAQQSASPDCERQSPASPSLSVPLLSTRYAVNKGLQQIAGRSSSTLASVTSRVCRWLLHSSVWLPVLAGCGSGLAFAYFHHLMPILGPNWYFYSFPNDHYAPLTALVPASILGVLLEMKHRTQQAVRCIGGEEEEEERQQDSGLGLRLLPMSCSCFTSWVLGLLLGSIVQLIIISNFLQRVVG